MPGSLSSLWEIGTCNHLTGTESDQVLAPCQLGSHRDMSSPGLNDSLSPHLHPMAETRVHTVRPDKVDVPNSVESLLDSKVAGDNAAWLLNPIRNL